MPTGLDGVCLWRSTSKGRGVAARPVSGVSCIAHRNQPTEVMVLQSCRHGAWIEVARASAGPEMLNWRTL